MAANWYYRTAAGKEAGPFPAEQLQALAAVGLIGPTTEIKKRSGGRWVPADKVRGLLDKAQWYYRNVPGEEDGPMSARQLRALAAVGLIGPTAEVKKRSGGRWVPARKVRGLLGGPAAPPTPTDGSLPTAATERAAPSHTPPPAPPEPAAATPDPYPDARAVAGQGWAAPAVWGGDSEAWGAPAPERRSPLLLVGAGSVGTLLVVGFLAFMFGDGDVSPTPELTGGAEWAGRRDAPPAPNDSLAEAKRLLLDRLADVGGSPEDNVKAGIDLLTKHLARPDAPDRDEAARLLEQARVALSDDKALQLLLDVGDFDRSVLAAKGNGGGRIDRLLVSKSRVDALCPAFSTRLKTAPAADGREARVFITGQDYAGGGRDHSSIETAFYETLKRNADRAIRRAAGRPGADREERPAALRDATDEFKRIVDAPGAHVGGHYSFDGVFGSRVGNMWRQAESMWYSVAFGCRDKRVPAFVRPVKYRLQFVVPDGLAAKLLDREDGESFARVFCRIRYADPDADAFPTAVIYKIEFYDNDAFKGVPKFTAE
jgi:hypothetical protein